MAQLKEQLECYEMELALRQMCQQTKSTKMRRLKSTDDKLPYELKPISKNWGLATSRLNKLQRTGKVPSPAGSQKDDRGASRTTPSGPAGQEQSYIVGATILGAGSSRSGSPSSSHLKAAGTSPSSRLKADQERGGAKEHASASTTTSSSSVEEMERTSRLSDLIMEIMKVQNCTACISGPTDNDERRVKSVLDRCIENF